jgi:hypothetical protein
VRCCAIEVSLGYRASIRANRIFSMQKIGGIRICISPPCAYTIALRERGWSKFFFGFLVYLAAASKQGNPGSGDGEKTAGLEQVAARYFV